MLIAADLLVDPLTGKERTLYSLRHTYATMRLLYGKNVTWELLEQQMDTSSAMQKKHYGHILPQQNADRIVD